MNDILERLYPKLRSIAINVAPGRDANLYDDLVQEMALAILAYRPGHTDALYLRRCADRARNYLKHAALQPSTFTDVGLDEYGAPRTADTRG